MQILAEGYLPVSSGPQQQTVHFDASNMFAFVKFVTVHGDGSTTSGSFIHTFGKMVRPPQITLWRWYGVDGDSPSQIAYGGDTCYAGYDGSSVVFFTFRGAPMYRYRRTSNGVREAVTVMDTAEIVGIRYYVFGIAI